MNNVFINIEEEKVVIYKVKYEQNIDKLQNSILMKGKKISQVRYTKNLDQYNNGDRTNGYERRNIVKVPIKDEAGLYRMNEDLYEVPSILIAIEKIRKENFASLETLNNYFNEENIKDANILKALGSKIKKAIKLQILLENEYSEDIDWLSRLIIKSEEKHLLSGEEILKTPLCGLNLDNLNKVKVK